MKKILFAIIIFIIPCVSYAGFLPVSSDNAVMDSSGVWLKGADGSDVRISRIASTVQTITTPSLSLKAAAEVTVKNSEGGIVKRALTSKITKSLGSSLVSGLAIYGALYLGEAYIDWLISQGDENLMLHKKDGFIYKSLPDGGGPCNFTMYGESVYLGNFPDIQGAWDAVNAYATTTMNCVYGGSVCSSMSVGKVCSNPDYMGVYQYRMTEPQVTAWATTGDGEQQWQELKLNEAEIYDIANDGYDDTPSQWQNAVKKALTVIDPALRDEMSPLRAEPFLMPKMCNILANAFDVGEASSLDSALQDPESAEQESAQELLDADTATSKNMEETNTKLDNINNKLGDDVPVPSDTLPLVQAKLNLTTVMQSFVTSLNQLPILNTLRGLTINCSGTSVLCVSLPSQYGGSQCVDFSGSTSTLNGIGTALLSITSIFMFAWVFKG